MKHQRGYIGQVQAVLYCDFQQVPHETIRWVRTINLHIDLAEQIGAIRHWVSPALFQALIV